METIKENPQSNTLKVLEVIKTMASKPSGLIGLIRQMTLSSISIKNLMKLLNPN